MFNFIKDLFKGNNNEFWDLGRILAFIAFVPVAAAVAYNAYKGFELDVAGIGAGIAAVVGAGAALIAAKQISSARVMEAQAALNNPSAPSTEAKVELNVETTNA